MSVFTAKNMNSSQYQWNLPTDIQEVGRTIVEVVGAGQRVPVRPRHHLGAVWSTLIGPGPSLLRSHWGRASLVMIASVVSNLKP